MNIKVLRIAFKHTEIECIISKLIERKNGTWQGETFNQRIYVSQKRQLNHMRFNIRM